jgi:hypothetical protein
VGPRLLDVHRVLGYSAIVANGIAGVIGLVAWRVSKWRGRWVWIVVIVAESALMLQVILGTILVASFDYQPPRIHMFYGFLVFITIGLTYQYRDSMRGRLELLYGLVGLFLMGLGIRAVLQVA